MDHNNVKPLGISVVLALSLALSLWVPPTAVADHRGGLKCKFPAVFNFGDSNSDTGGISAAMYEVLPPNGESYFGRALGRMCDGRLLLDFVAEELKLPYLSPYLDSLGTNFRHGANFATGGSSIREGGYSPFHLGIQVNQFLRLKSYTTALYGKSKHLKSKLPRPEYFSKALYTFDIGQNDLAIGFQFNPEEKVVASLPLIIGNLSEAIHKLYDEGARYFWIQNTGPIGCLPYNVIYYQPKPLNLDKYGCVEPQNAVAREFNRQLKKMVSKLRRKRRLGVFTYVDLYKAKYALISHAKALGFVDPMEFCCGSYYGYHINCGQKATVNGTVYGNPCEDPSNHISWDGVHYSQAANVLISNHALNGSLSDPPIPIREACRYS